MNLSVRIWNLKEPVEDAKRTRTRDEYLDPKGGRKRKMKTNGQ
jgi:hypothetical protein